MIYENQIGLRRKQAEILCFRIEYFGPVPSYQSNHSILPKYIPKSTLIDKIMILKFQGHRPQPPFFNYFLTEFF